MAEYHEYNGIFKLGEHHYAKQFAEDNFKVLWLSPMYNYLIYLKNKPVYNQRKSIHTSDFKEIEKNIYAYSPYSLSLYGKVPLLDTRLACKLSLKATVPSLKSVLKRNGFDKVDVLWLSNPKYFYLTELIDYNKLFYRCADDISGFDDICQSMIYFEERIIKQADKVFITAHNLMEKKKHLRDDFVYLPNGVELDNFIRDHYIEPAEFTGDKKKKCIYVGSFDTWFDIKLVKYCAEKLSDINFYLIGPDKIDMSILGECKNVFILGKRDYKDIPNYLYYSDAGIIPFIPNSLTDSVTPIKLYEYMSEGLNVVSTNFKEMQHIKSPAYVAKTYGEFSEYIMRAIESKEESRNRNIEFAVKNTWNKRYQSIKELL